MGSKPPRSPQDKKALSYARDCRNTYGENDKSSRKNIPLRKAQGSRQVRRKVVQDLAVLPKVDDVTADLIESSVRHDLERVGGWKKAADQPLGEIVALGLDARKRREGRKSRSRARKQSE
jgi:hypothetical protein